GQLPFKKGSEIELEKITVDKSVAQLGILLLQELNGLAVYIDEPRLIPILCQQKIRQDTHARTNFQYGVVAQLRAERVHNFSGCIFLRQEMLAQMFCCANAAHR